MAANLTRLCRVNMDFPESRRIGRRFRFPLTSIHEINSRDSSGRLDWLILAGRTNRKLTWTIFAGRRIKKPDFWREEFLSGLENDFRAAVAAMVPLAVDQTLTPGASRAGAASASRAETKSRLQNFGAMNAGIFRADK